MSGRYVSPMVNNQTAMRDKFNHLRNQGIIDDKADALSGKGAAILNFLESQYGGQTPPDEAALREALKQGVGGNKSLAVDIDGWWGQALNNWTGRAGELAPRDILNYLREQQVKGKYGQLKAGDEQSQALASIIDKAGLRFYPEGHELAGLRRNEAEVMALAQKIYNRKAEAQAAGLTNAQLGVENDYGLLFRHKDTNPKGIEDAAYTKKLGRVDTNLKLQASERDLNINPELVRGKTPQQRSVIILDATARRKNARALMDRYEAINQTNTEGYRRAVEEFRNPAGKSLSILGNQSSTGTTRKAGNPTVLAAVQAPTPGTPPAAPAAPATPGKSIETLEAEAKGELTPAQKVAEREKAAARLLREEVRTINRDRLNRWEVMNNANNALNEQLTTLEIERMKQAGEMEKWERQKEYDEKQEARKELLEAIEGTGDLFGRFFGNMFN